MVSGTIRGARRAGSYLASLPLTAHRTSQRDRSRQRCSSDRTRQQSWARPANSSLSFRYRAGIDQFSFLSSESLRDFESGVFLCL